MPRKPLLFLPDIPIHVVQRGYSREPVSFKDDDYFAYLRWFQQGAERYGVAIHAYVLMTNHINILASPLQSQRHSLLGFTGNGGLTAKLFLQRGSPR